jgi:DNA-binding response OmpR family regulator
MAATTAQELKVLLIEDNPGDAFLIKFYMGESTSPSFQLSHAEELKAGLELLSKDKFDIILVDLGLPDSFGVDTIKTILSQYPGNLVIVLTGLTDEEVGLETVRYGAQDFMVKGKFDGKVLISSIMFAFERFKLNKQIDNVNSQLSLENNRFDNVLKLTGARYFEIDEPTQKVFFAPAITVTKDSENSSLNDFESYARQKVDNADELIKQILGVFNTKTPVSFPMKHKDYNNPVQVSAEYQGGKVIGIIRYNG